MGPSGRWFVTHDGRALHVHATHGGERLGGGAPSGGHESALSGDGRWLAAIADGVPHLYRVDVDAIEAACDALEGSRERRGPAR